MQTIISEVTRNVTTSFSFTTSGTRKWCLNYEPSVELSQWFHFGSYNKINKFHTCGKMKCCRTSLSKLVPWRPKNFSKIILAWPSLTDHNVIRIGMQCFLQKKNTQEQLLMMHGKIEDARTGLFVTIKKTFSNKKILIKPFSQRTSFSSYQ